MKNKTFKNEMFSFVIMFLSFLFALNARASGTVIGNGGDPIFEFLSATRESMIETIKLILNDPKEQNSFCQTSRLNDQQIRFCQEYFLAVAPQILRLSQGDNQTPFVLRASPLYVVGPDGKPMIVSARTDLGPSGPIEFHRDSVKTMTPTQVLFLITHEFEHKTIFQGHSVGDNEQIKAFASGRALLDSVASAVVTVAKKKGKIGSQFGISDIFECAAITRTAQLGAQVVTARLFQSEDLNSYETNIGKNPMDGSIFLRENINTSLRLRFTITEPNNCKERDPSRKTTVEILRSTKQPDNSIYEEILTKEEYAKNPMCPHEDPTLEISTEQVKFLCKYFGSLGTTASPFRINAK